MTLDERLLTILFGSPAPLPFCEGGVWAGTARQGTAPGFVVFWEVDGTPILTQDLQVESDAQQTRRHRYQFECRHTSRPKARAIASTLTLLLRQYRDSSPGIQRCVPLVQGRESWEETERMYRFDVDFDIMENFPEA